MKNWKVIVGAVAAVFALTSTTANAQFTERKIRVSFGVSAENPVSIGVKKMQEIVEQKSGGKMKIVPYYNGALGPDMQAVQALRGGTQEMVIPSSSPLIGLIKDIGIFDMPFLFANEKEVDAVLDGPAGDFINKKLEEIGLINLAYWENGFRNLTNSKRPVNKLEDIAGLKVRVMQNSIYLDAFKELGANAIPLNFGELFSALETKAVDGQENPNINTETFKMNEVQKYLTVTRHAYTPWIILYSKKLWDQLSKDEQNALKEAAIAGRKAQRDGNRVLDAESLESLKKKEMVVSTTFNEAERQRLVEKTKPVYDKNLPTFSKELVDLVFASLKQVRGK